MSMRAGICSRTALARDARRGASGTRSACRHAAHVARSRACSPPTNSRAARRARRARTKTIAYLIEQFKAAGLEPGGENGGWTQTVPMIRTQLQAPASFVGQPRRADAAAAASPTTSISAPSAPVDRVRDRQRADGVRRLWRDRARARLGRFQGRRPARARSRSSWSTTPTSRRRPGEPVAGKFGGKTMTYYGRWTYKFEEAARRGAIAALVVHETEAAGYGWNVVQSPAGESYNVVLAAGRAAAGAAAGLDPAAASPATCSSAPGYDFDDGEARRRGRAAFRPIDLKATFSADMPVDARADHQPQCHRQADRLAHIPTRRSAIGGHWDAYGIGPADAQGRDDPPRRRRRCARACRRCSRCARCSRPGRGRSARSLFAAWTGEERGLLGSEYYAQHPLFPMETMVANLTLDTLQCAGPVKDVGAGRQGPERDGATVSPTAAQAQGRYVTPEDHPERGLFYRADHFSFAKRGVPVLLDMALAGAYDLVRRRARGGRALAQRLHRQLLPPDLRRLVAELEPARRGAGGGPVLRDRRAPREQPRLAAMGPVVGIREGSGEALTEWPEHPQIWQGPSTPAPSAKLTGGMKQILFSIALLATTTSAAATPWQEVDRQTVRVGYADLDIASPQGHAKLRRRTEGAVRRACAQPGLRSTDSRVRQDACEADDAEAPTSLSSERRICCKPDRGSSRSDAHFHEALVAPRKRLPQSALGDVLRERFACNLRRIRTQAGLTQSELASAAGLGCLVHQPARARPHQRDPGQHWRNRDGARRPPGGADQQFPPPNAERLTRGVAEGPPVGVAEAADARKTVVIGDLGNRCAPRARFVQRPLQPKLAVVAGRRVAEAMLERAK